MMLSAELPGEILKPLKDVTATEGQPITLECEVSKPNLTAQWLKDGQPLTPSDRCKTVVEGCIHRLEIPEAVLDDEADYSIQIRDKSSKCMVLVEGEERVICLVVMVGSEKE
jgi:hypothetical protein